MLVPKRNTGSPSATAPVSPSSSTASPSKATIFDGNTDRILKFEMHGELTNYTVDLRLISETLPSEPSTYTETTPAMPFRIGQNIACHTHPGGYALSLREGGREVLRPFIWATAGATRITLISDADGFVVYGNGVETARLPGPLQLGADARLGAGFLKRFWTGEIEFFDIYNVSKFKAPFDGSIGRLSETGLIYSLET